MNAHRAFAWLLTVHPVEMFGTHVIPELKRRAR